MLDLLHQYHASGARRARLGHWPPGDNGDQRLAFGVVRGERSVLGSIAVRAAHLRTIVLSRGKSVRSPPLLYDDGRPSLL